jgi:SAM-dependent methyltransferase
MNKISKQTITDFGKQWSRYRDNDGYYGSKELLKDFLGPLLDLKELQGKTVVDVGSGSGRIVNMLLNSGVMKIYAVEPSKDALEICKKNTSDRNDQVEYLQCEGKDIPDLAADFVISLGVIHHIPDPLPTVHRAYEILKPGGKLIIWVYGLEGNKLYIKVFTPIRRLTPKLPDWILELLSFILNGLLSVYIFLCWFIPLPQREYAKNVLSKLTWKQRAQVVIFDQLNPTYAKYYSKSEIENLVRSGGFKKINTYHRHGYSWTICGEK